METAKAEIISFVKTYTGDLLAYTISKVQQKEIAEDIVQDTFLSAYEGYKNFKGKSNVKTWLFSILKNKIADHFRLKYKHNQMPSSDIFQKFFNKNERWKSEFRPQYWRDDEELPEDEEFKKIFNDCLDNLPEKWSSVVHLKFLGEYNSKEVCSKLDISKSNFWQIMHRAKLQLRNCIEMNWFKSK